ncbi:hypothetical protein TIFTF001_001721 [Ficus carica]|uniref:RIN4 pathogenic type III effector avirulence factor Avr cleavage site domain-containing protein n=1 Tax=Ficus carica TaxID=3494 RepID=A0AA88CQW8_FICCA|nr:hypothetical protein TIFTF001_001721 [Ficus carica]
MAIRSILHDFSPRIARMAHKRMSFLCEEEKDRPLPKFGEWDVNDPASAEGFTVIFNKARNEKKTGGKPESPAKEGSTFKHGAVLGKPPSNLLYSFQSIVISLVLTPRICNSYVIVLSQRTAV